jgi:two-component system nitrogen regulation sensor histidine kinase GlnL
MTTAGDRLRAILDSLRVGVVAIDANGRTELQNAEASRILGVSATATRGRKLEAYLGPEHPALSLLAEALRNQREVSAHACTLPQPSSKAPLIVDLSASPIGVEDEVDGAVLTLRDRTIGSELESLMDQRALSELFSQLAAGFAHEVRNPLGLGGIRGSSELLLGKLNDPELQRYPELIRDETDRILRLLDGLSEFEVVREYDPSIPELELDPDRMTQVFLNLVRNAVQAMGDRGRLVLRTRMDAQFQISSDEKGRLRMVRIDIDDTGHGISEKDMPHIFTPFFTRREHGTGLGLAVSQHWVVRHGGRIQAFHLPEGGTRMRVQLPVRRSA